MNDLSECARRAQVISGVELSTKLRAELKVKADDFEKTNGRKIGLAVVIVGENPASEIYVRNKIKACADVGIQSFSHTLAQDIKTDELINLIQELNTDKNIDGVLVQLPLPKHLSEREILSNINPRKDVDGFHQINAGALLLGEDCLAACTPSGVLELIKSVEPSLKGKHAVVIGRSNIVGKPVALLLLQENCTVTICHSGTKDLKSHTKMADILVVAIGKREFVTADMVKDGAIVIDVGINRSLCGKLYGDIAFDEVSKVASAITPVPGGVGPMTITMLLDNTIKAALK